MPPREPSPEEAEITTALGGLLRSAEVWVIRPRLRLFFGPRPHPLTLTRSLRALSNYAFLLAPSQSVFAWQEQLLLAWSTVNQRRSLGQFAKNAAILSQARTTGMSVLADSLRSAQRSLLQVLIHRLRAIGDVDTIQLARAYRRARWELAAGRALLADTRPRAVVVATQHNFQARAITLAARETNVPSVYVPHAPVASNPAYADLPFDYAALRGEREVAHYIAFGVDHKRMYAIGNLALDSRIETPANAENRIVVAPSPWDSESLTRFLRLVSLGVDSAFDVCPHPRSRPSALRRRLPDRARILANQPTWKRLSEGAVALIQHSSGVALEAMLMGIPVIEVRLGKDKPNYPLIQAPYAYFVDDQDQLRSTLGHIRAGESASLVHRRRNWARQWCETVGDEAERRLRNLLEADLEVGQPLLDGWRGHEGGTALYSTDSSQEQ